MAYLVGSNIRGTARELGGILPETTAGKILLVGGIGLLAYLVLGKKRGRKGLIGKTLTFSGTGGARRVRVNPRRRRRRRSRSRR